MVARRQRLDPEQRLLTQESSAAIAAGALHNDVFAVANEHVLFAPEQASAEASAFYASLRRLLPPVEFVEVPKAAVSLADVIASYLFNARLVTLPKGGRALILPLEARCYSSVWTWLNAFVSCGGPIRELELVNVRESMAKRRRAGLHALARGDRSNADGPALPRKNAALDRCGAVIRLFWPEEIYPKDLCKPTLWAQCRSAGPIFSAPLVSEKANFETNGALDHSCFC